MSQKRIIMWCHPRSLSTVLLRSMSRVDKCRVINEPFTGVYITNSHRSEGGKETSASPDNYTYSAVRNLLEDCNEFEDCDVVYVKDMGFSIWPEHLEFIPCGFVHAFLIRDPQKTIRSYYKLWEELKGILNMDMIASDCGGYKSMVGIMNYLHDELKQEFIVLDADDLVKNPEKYLRSFCENVGISFTKKMLSWEPISSDDMVAYSLPIFLTEDEKKLANQVFERGYQNAMRSTAFFPSKSSSSEIEPKSDDKKVKKLIDEALPFYQILHEKRLKV